METPSPGDTFMGDAWDPASALPPSHPPPVPQGIDASFSHPSFVMKLPINEDASAAGLEASVPSMVEASDAQDYRRSASLLSASPQPPNNQSRSARQTAVYTKGQWDEKKDLIERLWILENRPWESKKHPDESVEQILRLEYNFPVTKRQFLRRTEGWGFFKNVKRKEMQAIDIIERKREATSGKKTEFQVRGRQVPSRKLERWRRSHESASPAKLLDYEVIEATSANSAPVDAVLVDLEISYGTPKESSSMTIPDAFYEALPSEPLMLLDGPDERTFKEEEVDEINLEFDFSASAILGSSKPSRLLQALTSDTNEDGSMLSFDAENISMENCSDVSQNSVEGQDIRDREWLMKMITTRPRISLTSFDANVSTKRMETISQKTTSWHRLEEKRWRFTLHSLTSKGVPLPERLPAMSKLAWSLFKQSKYTPAERIFRHVAVESSRTYGKMHRKTIDAYCDAVKCLFSQSQFLKAAKVHGLLRIKASEMLSSDDELLLSILFLGAQISTRLSKYDDTESTCRALLEVVLATSGRTSELLLSVLESLAAALYHKKLLRESEEVLFRLLHLQRDSAHRDKVSGLRLLAYVMMEQGRCNEAEYILRNILANSKERLGPEHESSLETLANLSWCFRRQEKYEEARKIGETAWKATSKNLGAAHATTLHALHSLAAVCSELGQHKDAVAYQLERVAGLENTRGPNHEYTVRACSDLGLSYHHLQEYANSLAWYQRANAGYRNLFGEEHPDYINTQERINWLTTLIPQSGRIEEDGTVDHHFEDYEMSQDSDMSEHHTTLDDIMT